MNLAVSIRHYISNHRVRHQTELDWFRNQPTLTKAIEVSAMATNQHGKRLSHQRRLKKVVLEEAKDTLWEAENALKECKNFEILLECIEIRTRSICGIGELYRYDTALRIGAYLEVSPEKVYLHAGTREGAKILGIDPKLRHIDPTILPKEFNQLSPDEIEDALCIYKKHLGETTISSKGTK